MKTIGKWTLAGALAISMLSGAVGEVGQAPVTVEAATKLPDNHTIEQLKVEYTGNDAGYKIHVGNRIGTLLIRIDQPKVERNIEWINWSITKPSEVAFSMYPTTDKSKKGSLSAFYFSSNQEKYLVDKGVSDKSYLDAGLLKTGLMKFSDFSDPSYYAGLSIYLDKKYSEEGVYWFGGDSYSLKEDGQVKAYFFTNQDVVLEAHDRIKKEGTFPLMNKVMWGKTELWKGQLGKVSIKKPVTLWKRLDNGILDEVRDLKTGDEFRVYRYLNEKSGLYGVGAGMFLERNASNFLYETPSKRNLRLVKIMHGEE